MKSQVVPLFLKIWIWLGQLGMSVGILKKIGVGSDPARTAFFDDAYRMAFSNGWRIPMTFNHLTILTVIIFQYDIYIYYIPILPIISPLVNWHNYGQSPFLSIFHGDLEITQFLWPFSMALFVCFPEGIPWWMLTHRWPIGDPSVNPRWIRRRPTSRPT